MRKTQHKMPRKVIQTEEMEVRKKMSRADNPYFFSVYLNTGVLYK